MKKEPAQEEEVLLMGGRLLRTNSGGGELTGKSMDLGIRGIWVESQFYRHWLSSFRQLTVLL